MKKLYKSVLSILLIVTFSACQKLDLAPEDYFASESFWKTSAQVDGAMIGLHNQLRGFQFTIFTLGELRGGTLRDISSFT